MTDNLTFGQRPATLVEFVEGADAHFHATRATIPDYRIGQAYSNYFFTHFPEDARRIIATNTDPFYTDMNIGRLIEWAMARGCVRA